MTVGDFPFAARTDVEKGGPRMTTLSSPRHRIACKPVFAKEVVVEEARTMAEECLLRCTEGEMELLINW